MPKESNENLAEIVGKGASRPLRKWLWITLGAIVLGGGGYYYYFQQGEETGRPEFITVPTTRSRIALIVTAAGNLAPTNQVVVGSELSGTAQEVYVDSNDIVKRGQPLAKLDTSKLLQQTERSRASLLVAKARVSQAKATLQENQAAYARQQELHELSGGKTPSRATMETALASVSRAKADLESADASVVGAEAEVRSFERDLEKAIVCSPVDGMVLSRSIEVGQTVAASFTAPTLFTIAEDLKKMELIVAVTEADIGRVEVGQTATFTVDAWPSRSYTAKVKKVAFGAAGTANTGNNNGGASQAGGMVTYSTELEVANDDLSLRPGMTASVEIAIVDKSDIIVVPNSALRFDPVAAAALGKPEDGKRTLVQSLSPGGGRRWWRNSAPKGSASNNGPRVWTIKDGEPVEVLVTTGISDGRVTEIISGDLAPETPVIVSIKPITTA